MQYTWTYTDPPNTIYNIGLYHGLDTGHVMVYCNDSIVIIDFNILEQKKYSFYIGEEFFELFLNKNEDGSFSYELKINNTVYFITGENYPFDELYNLSLISNCKSHIISNSSFYWWGAWIAEAKKKSNLIISSKKFSNKDAIPSRWVLV